MRYRKSPLAVSREYVKIQKPILRLLLMAKSWFLCRNVCFWGWGFKILGLIKANIDQKLSFDFFFRFSGVSWGQELGMKDCIKFCHKNIFG